MKDFLFKVESLEAGQRRKYGDSYYHYKITSKEREHIVKMFATKVLQPCCEKEKMPNPFYGELIEFKKETSNSKSFLERKEETYSFKTKSLYTG